MHRAVLFAIAMIGCSSDAPSPPPPAPVAVLVDAGVDGITAIGAHDPASGMHLDDGGGNGKGGGKPKARTARTIDIMLRSTPPGAIASVGGVVVGDTPALWSGEPDGKPVDFVFTHPGYAAARYRFIPITSGLVHARLEAIAVEVPHDGGLAPQIAPTFAPDAGVAPPPTVLTPIDAAPRTEPPPVAPDAAPPPAPSGSAVPAPSAGSAAAPPPTRGPTP